MPVPIVAAAAVAATTGATTTAAAASAAGASASAAVALTAKRIVFHVATTESAYAASSATLAYILTRIAYNKIPNWIKEDVAVQNLIIRNNNNNNKKSQQQKKKSNHHKQKNNNDDDGSQKNDMLSLYSNNKKIQQQQTDELTNLTSVIEKLQALIVSGSNKLIADNVQPVPYIQIALLLYIQLSGQMHYQNPIYRNQWYESAGTPMKHLNDALKYHTTTTSATATTTTRDEYDDAEEGDCSVASDDNNDDNHHHHHHAADSDNDTGTLLEPETGTPYTIHQILDFVIWAYEGNPEILQNSLHTSSKKKNKNLMNNNCTNLNIIQHDIQTTDRPGYLGYYIAIDSIKKVMIIGIKGTSTLGDLFTDCCGRAVTYNGHMDYNDTTSPHKICEDTCIEVQMKQSDYCFINTTTTTKKSECTTPTNTTMSATEKNHSCDPTINFPTFTEENKEEEGIEIVENQDRIWVESYFDDENNHNQKDGTKRNVNYFDEINEQQSLSNQHHKIRCHEGILISTKRLANKVQKYVETYVVHEKYQLLICGHSLGAGAASLLGVILHTRIPELQLQQQQQQSNNTNTFSSDTTSDCNIDHSIPTNRIKVYAFAPPPVLDYDTAIAVSSYTTSIVNNSDLIPRSSLSNLIVFIEFLRCISERIVSLGYVPNNPYNTTRLIRKLLKGVTDPDCILSHDEIQVAIHNTIQKFPDLQNLDHLYIPGKVIIMYDDWLFVKNRDKKNVPKNEPLTKIPTERRTTQQNSDDNNNNKDSRPPADAKKDELVIDSLHDDSMQESQATPCSHEQQQDEDHDDDRIYDNDDGDQRNNPRNEQHRHRKNRHHHHCIVTDGASPVLRFFEIDSFRFATDHTTSSYEAILNSFLTLQENTCQSNNEKDDSDDNHDDDDFDDDDSVNSSYVNQMDTFFKLQSQT